MHHEIRTSEPQAHSSQTNAFDFESHIASRSYERLPEGSFMPPLRREAAYAMIFASHDAMLNPGPVSLDSSNSAQFLDENHEPLGYDVRWNDNGVYMSFKMHDVDIVLAENCTDQMSVQLSDHVELWFDLSPALAVRSDEPQSWMLEYEKNYRNEPYRHSIDADVLGLAVTADGCAVPMTPSRENWPVMPAVSAEKTDTGYQIDVFVPSAFFGKPSIGELDRAQGIGFTARQHDVHVSGRFESIATSSWQWPDPFTFGQIWLMLPLAQKNPPFPLQWNTWLEK